MHEHELFEALWTLTSKTRRTDGLASFLFGINCCKVAGKLTQVKFTLRKYFKTSANIFNQISLKKVYFVLKHIFVPQWKPLH